MTDRTEKRHRFIAGLLGASIAFLALVIVLVAVGGSSDEPDVTVAPAPVGTIVLTIAVPTPTARPGSPAVYERIAALNDCTALQRELEIALGNYDPKNAPTSASPQLSYAKAADDRMREIGCYR